MSSRRAILLAALASLATHAALAHGPTRQKLVLHTDIAAPPDTVWAAIGDFHDLSWVPAVAKTEGTGGNEPGIAKRTITLKSGGVLQDEELSDYDARKHDYGTFLPHVDPKMFPVADYSSHLVVLPAEGGGSHVEWRTAFYRGYPNNDPPPDQNEDAATRAVTAYCQPALDALKAKLEAAH